MPNSGQLRVVKIRWANGPRRVRSRVGDLLMLATLRVSVPGVVIGSLSRDKGAALGGLWAVSAPAEVPLQRRRAP